MRGVGGEVFQEGEAALAPPPADETEAEASIKEDTDGPDESGKRKDADEQVAVTEKQTLIQSKKSWTGSTSSDSERSRRHNDSRSNSS